MTTIAPLDRLLVSLPGVALRQLWRDDDGAYRWYTIRRDPRVLADALRAASDGKD